jgi:conjugal transfer pilus assembly protein TrbC
MLHLLPMTVVIFFSLVVAAMYVPSWAQEVTSILEKAEIEAKKITLPINRYTDAGLQAAEETSQVFYSPEFQERVRSEEQRLEQEVFADHIKPWKTKHSKVRRQVEQTSTLADTEKVYLFFSSSLPDQTAQAYIRAVARAGDSNLVPVMRGWVNDMANPKANTEYFSRILQKDPACQSTNKPCEHYEVGINLQPELFTTYGITQVPAVVYVNDKATYQIKGDAGLDYLLERINRDAQSETLDHLIQKIRGS